MSPLHLFIPSRVNNKLRIAIIDHAPVLGGVEVFVNDLISTVDQNKFDLRSLITHPCSAALKCSSMI
ncbi:MAG: hypothetical protein HZC38_10700 [Chloroflexi bacterium]|nr:hypothetical protein [Chloroflexota bacterium]